MLVPLGGKNINGRVRVTSCETIKFEVNIADLPVLQVEVLENN